MSGTLETPVHKREYHVFLSHASSDKKRIVDEIYAWLTKIAAIPVWYDQAILSGGSGLQDSIGKAIPQCRSMVIVLSAASVVSPWVKTECTLAVQHKMSNPDFKIIPILIEDCEVPVFLQDALYIEAKGGQLTPEFYKSLLQALYPFDPSVEFRNTKDIYVSRTWRSSEARLPDQVCRQFIGAGFRLIGDSTDQSTYKRSKERVESIISSCGGLLAILPYRNDKPDNYFTSPYCLDEIATAKKYGLPTVVIAEPGVELPDSSKASLAYFHQVEASPVATQMPELAAGVETMAERWKPSDNERYVFFATNFDNPERHQMARQLIQQITGMSCRTGEEIQDIERSIQEAIAHLIRRSALVIADVSQENLNTMIEAGIARGAQVECRMIAAAPRKRPVFMFRDKQIEYYENDAEYLGRIHRLAYPFRRRILNREIKL